MNSWITAPLYEDRRATASSHLEPASTAGSEYTSKPEIVDGRTYVVILGNLRTQS